MSGRAGFITLGLIAWGGVILYASQRGEPPVGLSALALMAVWLAVFFLAAWGAAACVWRLVLRRGPIGWDEAIVALILGAATLGILAAGLGVVGMMRTLPLTLLLGIGCVIAALELRSRSRSEAPAWRLPARTGVPAAIAGVTWASTLLSVTVDSAFYDQLHYHLAFPALWLRAGHLITLPREDFSFYPAGMGLLYVFPLALLGPAAAQMVHWGMGVLAVLAASRLALRLGGAVAAWWTAAILSATPVLMWLSTLAGADLGVAAYAAAAWLLIAMGLEEKSRDRARWWALAGAAAGLAAGAKLLAALTVAAPLFVALALASRERKRRVARLVPFALGASLMIAPWFLRNFIATGNPVYPFLPALFARGSEVADQVRHAQAQGALRFMSDPVRVLTLGALGQRDGTVGPLYLILVPFAVWWGMRSKTLGRLLLLGSAAGVLGWALGPPTARYLVPVLPPLAVLSGAGLAAALERAPGRARTVLGGVAAVVCSWSLLAGIDRETLTRTAIALGREERDAVREHWVSYWPAVAAVNELPGNSRVLLVGESRSLYLDRDVLLDDPYRTPLLSELATHEGSSRGIALDLRGRGVTHVLFNGSEASRLAALNSRAEYFGDLSTDARARLDALRAEYLRPVWKAGTLELFALDDPTTASASVPRITSP